MASITINIDDTIVGQLASAATALYPSVVGTLTGLDAVRAAVVSRMGSDLAQYNAQQAIASRDVAWQNEINKTTADVKGKIT